MKISDILSLRLQNQQIKNSKFKKPEDLVSYLGAVQSQDFYGAKWALGLRLLQSTDKEIEQAFNEAKILRTHALRPTWHFVSPQDIRWIVELNAPQVRKIMSYYNKMLDLDDKVFTKTKSIIIQSLKTKKFLTRKELTKILAENGIRGTGQRYGHILMEAELDNLICNGPLKGKQFTYALTDEVAPSIKSISRDEALGKLAEIFFKTRGPATVKDFSKWSYLSQADCKKGLAFAKSKFQKETINHKEYWFSHSLPQPKAHVPRTLLLPNYDEYISSYSDYTMITTEQTRKNLEKIGNAQFWNHMVLDGTIVGSWRRVFKKKAVEIEFAPLVKLKLGQGQAFKKEAQRFARFYQLKAIF